MSKKQKGGFTLLELLVVVIIIAVLAAVAVPMYKHAVLKSRFSAVMPMAKSVADANEVYYLGKNMYALGQDDLDVTPVAAENTSVKLSGEYQNADENYEYVAAWRTDVPGVRYIQYQKNSPKFAGNIHCEADETNEDALWLCEKGLNGTEIPGSINQSAGEYRTFLLSGNTGEDKLPTSFHKQVAACEQSANCTVLQQGDNTTLQECEGNLTGTNTKTCTNITYDEDGKQVGYEKTAQQCGQTVSYYAFDSYNQYQTDTTTNRSACITRTYDEKDTQTGYTPFVNSGNQYIIGEDGYIIASTSTCGRYDDGIKCSEGNIITYVPDGNGKYMQMQTRNCVAFKVDGTCETFAGTGYFYDFADTRAGGEWGSVKVCSSLNSDGSCAVYKEKYKSNSKESTSILLCSIERGNIDTTTGECL